jgi:2-hydroxymuconate-semialdehyde hydrolase
VVSGISTNYHDQGEGPPVLLLHGSGPGVSAWANWGLAIPAWSKQFRVIAPDQIGFGFTDPPIDGKYTLQRWVNHVVSLLDHLQIERTNLVGNSFGAAVALRVAIEHPQRVGRLVLMGPVGVSFPITAALDEVWGYLPSVESMRRMLDLFADDRGLVTDKLAELRYRASIRPGVQEAFSAMFPAPRQRWVDAMASSSDEIAGIAHETLIVHGRDDRVIPPATSLRLLELISASQLHVFGRCGHWVQIEHASAFNRLVAEFLS